MVDLSKYTKELSKHFSESDNILLICHINPDGDAIGSQLALYHYLRSIGRKVEMLSPNYLQEFIIWMDGVEEINIYIRDRKKCNQLIENSDLIVMLDFNQSSRLGESEKKILRSGAKKIIIDHHQGSGSFADLVISDTSKCSTSELLHEIICNINNGIFSNRAYSEAIYVGIVTDTGNFEHGTYTGNTFRIIADLVDSGIDRDRIFNLVFNNFTVERMRLQGFALHERMTFLPEYRTAYIYLTRDDLERFNYKKGDTEGFVNLPLSIGDVDFSALFLEKKGFIKLSFRSKGDFSVDEFARDHFSGGGHINAAGGEYFDTLDKTLKHFLKALKKDAWKITGSK